MIYLAFSLVFSVSVSILLKLVPRFSLDVRQAVFVNYVVACALTWTMLSPDMGSLAEISGWIWGALILLGVGLPSMFWVLAAAIRTSGIVRTDAAMRLSLLVPLAASFTLLGEVFSLAKGVGIAVGFIAILLVVLRPDSHPSSPLSKSVTLLLVVFVGMGVIDILFKVIAALSAASSNGVLFAVFGLAAITSWLAIVWLYVRGTATWRVRHMGAGLVLGVLNFGNIYCYIQAHRAMPTNPSLVFAAMNIGVIVLATIIGVLAFRERLSRINSAGLLLAVVAVIVLAFA